MYISLTDLPGAIQSALTSYGYRRQDIAVTAAETYSPHVAGGSGQRGFCVCVDVSTGTKEERVGSWGGANIFNARNQVDLDTSEYPIPPNCAVITGSRGDKTFASVVVHPAMMPALLPSADNTVTDADRAWLYILRTFKSAYRKDGARSAGVPWPNADRLAFLQGKGLIKVNKAGSVRITTDGKNAADKGSYRIY